MGHPRAIDQAGNAKNYGPPSSCTTTEVASERSRLQAITGELSERVARAESLNNRLEAVLDNVAGAVPTAASNPGSPQPVDDSPQPVDGSILGGIESKVGALYYFLDHLDDQIRRLERIVG